MIVHWPDRLLVTLPIPVAVAREIAWVREAYRLVGRFVRDELLHVTLGWFGDYARLPIEIVDRAATVLSTIRLAACHVNFDMLVRSPDSIMLKASEKMQGLLRLQRELVGVLVRAGLPLVPGWRFDPHITASYPGSAGFAEPIDPISWRAEEVVLVRSLVGATRHEVLRRCPLQHVASGT